MSAQSQAGPGGQRRAGAAGSLDSQPYRGNGEHRADEQDALGVAARQVRGDAAPVTMNPMTAAAASGARHFS